MNREDVRIETDINADPETVWSVISDFDNWNDWHKESEMNGVKVFTDNHLPRALSFIIAKIPMKITLSDVEINEGTSMAWRGFLPFSKTLLSGERTFKVISCSGSGCRLIQTETFHGVISRFVKKRLSIKYTKNYELLNQAIKRIAES